MEKTNKKILQIGDDIILKNKFKSEEYIVLQNHILSVGHYALEGTKEIILQKFSSWDRFISKGVVLVQVRDVLERLLFISILNYNLETVLFKKDLPMQIKFSKNDLLICIFSNTNHELKLQYLRKLNLSEKKYIHKITNRTERYNIYSNFNKVLDEYKKEFPNCEITLFKNGYILFIGPTIELIDANKKLNL